MPKLRVLSMSYTLDGFSAGANQRLDNPLGDHGAEMMGWFFPTRHFRKMQGQEGGETGVDNSMAEKSFENIGAWILGRNMFGPVRGAWPDEDWKGWWGEEPPYHCDTYVLTHHARKPLVMKGGTTFHFVTEGIEAALARAKDAAGGREVHVAGGPSTTNAYLAAGLVDELRLNINPVVAGRGIRLFDGVGPLRLEQISVRAASLVTHAHYRVLHDG